MEVRGYKVFNGEWQCREKKYICPGKFEEDVKPMTCEQGMHFCKQAVDCFNYYEFDPNNKVAEVIAYGEVAEDGDKCCTDKLEIVREIPWAEVLEIVNTGKGCTGLSNSGNQNSGDWNSGYWNSGDQNSGYRNSGNQNSGYWNSGNQNSGNQNSGYRNSGNQNSGDWNSGNQNSGYWNSGDQNSGNRNSGDWNSGNQNSGDWNSGDYSSGCFNTAETKIYLFNKPSDWKYSDWRHSRACCILSNMPFDDIKWIVSANMTETEKNAHPKYKTTGGFLRNIKAEDRQKWWNMLSDKDKNEVKSLPNFDAEIFKEITGISVGEDKP